MNEGPQERCANKSEFMTLFMCLPSGSTKRVKLARFETTTVSSLIAELPAGLQKRYKELTFAVNG